MKIFKNKKWKEAVEEFKGAKDNLTKRMGQKRKKQRKSKKKLKKD